jgi:hypothetical protein
MVVSWGCNAGNQTANGASQCESFLTSFWISRSSLAWYRCTSSHGQRPMNVNKWSIQKFDHLQRSWILTATYEDTRGTTFPSSSSASWSLGLTEACPIKQHSAPQREGGKKALQNNTPDSKTPGKLRSFPILCKCTQMTTAESATCFCTFCPA